MPNVSYLLRCYCSLIDARNVIPGVCLDCIECRETKCVVAFLESNYAYSQTVAYLLKLTTV
jgi:hypothetical protein